ncbi:uncharacterized protein LOC126264630 [Aethina tumida]|uniref:uncharacterized protein LOC126264630 n=1 Tax=Aethina tumida TaxID=116153 RepID=UPI0021472110|nr:uncharacterized protein LOC126264630 [Aethina tumida]
MRELNKQMAVVDKQLKREREDKLEIQVQCQKMTMELIHIHKNIEYQREFGMMHEGPFCLTAINVNDIKNEVPKQNLELDNLLKRVNQLKKERLEKVNVQKKDESVEVLDNNSIIVDRHLWDNMNKFIVLK